MESFSHQRNAIINVSMQQYQELLIQVAKFKEQGIINVLQTAYIQKALGNIKPNEVINVIYVLPQQQCLAALQQAIGPQIQLQTCTKEAINSQFVSIKRSFVVSKALDFEIQPNSLYKDNQDFQSKRLEKISLIAKQSGVNTYSNAQNNLNSFLIKTDQEGWLNISKECLNQGIYSIDGVSVNVSTQVATLLIKETQNHQTALLKESDIRFIFENGISSMSLSLEHNEAVIQHNPYQQIQYYPQILTGTEILSTLFQTDYLLKQFIAGSQIQYRPPYKSRDIFHLFQNLPQNHKLRDLKQYQIESSHRFWIENEVVEYEKQQLSPDTFIFHVKDPRMIIQRHKLKNTGGVYTDNEINSDNYSPEANMAALLTLYYKDIGEYFPEFLRLQKILQLCAINELLCFLNAQNIVVKKIQTNLGQINFNSKTNTRLMYDSNKLYYVSINKDQHQKRYVDPICSYVPTVFNLKNQMFVCGGVKLQTDLRDVSLNTSSTISPEQQKQLDQLLYDVKVSYMQTFAWELGEHLYKQVSILCRISTVLKKIPFASTILVLKFAKDRYKDGDIQGAYLEIASGVIGQVPVGGWALSFCIDYFNYMRDAEKILEENKK